MKYLSEKITDYVIKTGAASEESYAIYQYGFQIGLEMVSCFLTCFCIAIWLHMIPEFGVFTIVFMLLRTYAGGLHLNRFGACFLCSVSVQTLILVINSKFTFPVIFSWILISRKNYTHVVYKRLKYKEFMDSSMCIILKKHYFLYTCFAR